MAEVAIAPITGCGKSRLAGAALQGQPRLMQRGLLSTVRRRRAAVDLIAGYALILNLLISALMGTHAIAANLDPTYAFLGASICSINAPAQPGKQQLPAKSNPECPLCGIACPMGGCAPLPGPVLAGLSYAPRTVSAEPYLATALPIRDSNSRYPSDQVSQAPPAAV